MMKLKSYTCPSCGSVLQVENNQRILDCPFCGSEFQAVSFHRKEVVSSAGENLKNKEFTAAREKYLEILTDNPYDVDALLGLICCSGKIPEQSAFSRIRDLSQYNAGAALKVLRAQEGCQSEEAKPYFDKLAGLLEKAERWQELDSKVNAIRSDNRNKYEEITGIKERETTLRGRILNTFLYIGSLFGAEERRATKEESLLYQGAGGLFMIFMGILIYMIIDAEPEDLMKTILTFFGWVLGILALVALVSFIITKIYQHKEYKVRELTQGNHTEFMGISSEMSELSAEYEKEYQEMKKLRPTEIPVAKRKRSKEDVFSEEEKETYCSQCGGKLFLDRERSLYTCKYCGVALGASFFIGDVDAKARKALAVEEFEEAELRFSHVLMMHPDDYEALVGRVLATGKWRAVRAMKLPERMPPYLLKEFNARIEEGKAHAKKEDQEIFDEFSNISALIQKADPYGKKKTPFEKAQWESIELDFKKVRDKLLSIERKRNAAMQ